MPAPAWFAFECALIDLGNASGRNAVAASARTTRVVQGGHPTNVASWHLADNPTAPEFVAYWTNNGQKAALGLDLSAAIDPSATFAVRCGNSFDAGFSPYQNARLSRYD